MSSCSVHIAVEDLPQNRVVGQAVDTYSALGKISGHELEEADLAHIHVLPVVVLLPLPAAVTPLLNHLPKCNHTTLSQHKYFRGSDAEGERNRVLLKLGHVLVASCEPELPR